LNEQPTAQRKRIDLLDVYRGFAIFGIFVVNSVIMNSTFLNQDEFAKQFTSAIDQVSVRVLQFFFYTKFFPIFSLLFGMGIAMQALKLLETNTHSVSFFVRRMCILFIFGSLHIVLLWSGDVLHLYALIGLFTFLLIKKSNKTILTLAVITLLFPFYDVVLEFLFNLLNLHPENFLKGYTGATVHQIITTGTYFEGVQLRVREYLSNLPMLLGFLAPIAGSMFLLGLYLGKNKIYNSLDTYIQRIKKPMLLLAVITNVYRLVFLFVLPNYDVYSQETLRPVFIKLMVVSDSAMGLFYLWLIGWLWYHTKMRVVLSVLKYVGRMALTNYILQSVIGLILFSSIGFQLYETLSPSATLIMAVGVFVFQLLLSKLWLTYFQFGPLEWAWRCLSYKKLLPLKKKTGNVSTRH